MNIGSSFPIRLKSLSDHVRTLQDRSYKNWIQLACYTKSDPPIPIFTTSVILLPEYPVQLIWMNMYANVARTCTTHLSTLHYAQPNNEAKYIMPKHKYNTINYLCERLHLRKNTIDIRHNLWSNMDEVMPVSLYIHVDSLTSFPATRIGLSERFRRAICKTARSYRL